MSVSQKKIMPHQELLRLHQKIYQENQKLIKEHTQVGDKNFKKYFTHYKKTVETYQHRVSVEMLNKKIFKSDVVLVGDYHTLNQSQKSFLRILKAYSEISDKKIVVALEILQQRHQKYLDAFLRNAMTEEDFLKKIGFKKHWFFDLWQNYKIIFDYLKEKKIETIAIDAPSDKKNNLKMRDTVMAKNIVDTFLKNDAQIFVLVGDLHLAPQHLPAEIKRVAESNDRSLNVISLYQNSPEIYWQLGQKNQIQNTLVVQISASEFCRMHTPPIIVQQSYLNWLYHEDDEFDWMDAKSSFVELVKNIASLLHIELPPDYDDVEVYTCGDLSFLDVLRDKKIFSAQELKAIHYQILHSQSYFIPRARLAYIANVSIHHAAEEASHYLKILCSGQEQPRSHLDAFYANVLHEALGFFGSKLINAKRKCLRYADFLKQVSSLPKKQTSLTLEQQVAVLFVEHEKHSRKKRLFTADTVAAMSAEVFMAVSHALGYDLGEKLYHGFLAQKVKRERITELFYDPFEEECEPQELYLTLWCDLDVSLKRAFVGKKKPRGKSEA